jgi:hypothetical protein
MEITKQQIDRYLDILQKRNEIEYEKKIKLGHIGEYIHAVAITIGQVDTSGLDSLWDIAQAISKIDND